MCVYVRYSIAETHNYIRTCIPTPLHINSSITCSLWLFIGYITIITVCVCVYNKCINIYAYICLYMRTYYNKQSY